MEFLPKDSAIRFIYEIESILDMKYGFHKNPYKDKIDKTISWIESTPYRAGIHSRRTTRVLGLINIAINDFELSEETTVAVIEQERTGTMNLKSFKPDNRKIFIVHGHNELMKQNVARIIERCALKPIILHEQPNKGRTIIEKFIENSEVGFAIVLLSADDIGYSKKGGVENAMQRARQNVIFELGFFTAKLGRQRVVALVENSGDFETPSDIHGVIYIPFDKPDGQYQYELMRELISCGYYIDMQKQYSY